MPLDLLLTYDFPPLGGGISRWMAELAKGYPPGELVVLTGGHPGAEEVDPRFPNPVERVPGRRRRLRNLPGLARWARMGVRRARRGDARFIWCGNVRPATHPAWWIRFRTGTPYGVIAHGKDLLELEERIHRSRWMRWLMGRLLAPAEVYVANSRWTARLWADVLDALGLHRHWERVRVVKLGTDPGHFRPDVDTGGVRRRYRLEEGRWLVTVARLVPHKGFDTAIRALARLAARFPDLRYAAVGTGYDLPRLRELAASLGVGDRVRFLGGVPDADLPGLLALADVYLGLSRRAPREVEGFGISIVEASACGTPVVAGRSGGIPDAVEEGRTALLVDPESPAEAAETAARILENRELARRLGSGGRRAVETVYNWERVVADLRALAAERGKGGA